ncbi:MAG: polysaccharide deacetylase family protein [Defluviitaleaceae bacterium]|nr:polysaccharide deacetylase family protein [Defluviitaleaceae bacterium]
MDKPVIALTFDDGPNTTITVQILDILEKHDAVATFFVKGCNITPETTKVMQRAVALGCEIANHTENHPNLTHLGIDDVKKEVASATKKIFEAIGQKPKIFRSPYIAENDEIYAAVPLTFIDGYHVADYDSNNDVAFRVDRALSQAHDGAVLIMHDFEGNHQTVEALEIIIHALKEQEYGFVTAGELIDLKKPESLKFINNLHLW